MKLICHKCGNEFTGFSSRLRFCSNPCRLWGRVNTAGPDECWLWTGGTKRGYGALRLSDQTVEYAHRLSWMLNNGPIPKGMDVLHRCDTPRCVNPQHMFLGTQQDNVKDMDQKGRRNPVRGERGGRARLTEAQVIEIRLLYANTDTTYHKLGCLFGVDFNTIQAIVSRRNWAHVK